MTKKVRDILFAVATGLFLCGVVIYIVLDVVKKDEEPAVVEVVEVAEDTTAVEVVDTLVVDTVVAE